MMIKVNCNYINHKLSIDKYQEIIKKISEQIDNKSGAGNEFLGWVDYANNIDKGELESIQTAANKIKNECNCLVICGIGGSYLGSRAINEMINGFYNNQKIEIIYLGNTLSATYTRQVLDYLEQKEFAINVISKSGGTLEPAIAFILLKELAIKKYGTKKLKERLFITTDKEDGQLKRLADTEGYQTFVIPSNIGGRYSVFTPVGLLPLAVSGVNIKELLAGVNLAMKDFKNFDNEAYKYALTRYLLHIEAKKSIEIFITYEPHLMMFAEWWKQLFGESEGKHGKGIFPTSATFSTDLHSLGQFIQDGNKIFFQTTLDIKKSQKDVIIPQNTELPHLKGKNLSSINNIAFTGTLEAHSKVGNNPNIIIEFTEISPKSVGYLCYFFFKACATSAYLFDLNPFDQPGVEIYKQEIKKLLLD